MPHQYYPNSTASKRSASPAETTPGYRDEDVPDTPAASDQQDLHARRHSNVQEADLDHEMLQALESDDEGEFEHDDLFHAATTPSVRDPSPRSDDRVSPDSLDHHLEILNKQKLDLEKSFEEIIPKIGNTSYREASEAIETAHTKLTNVLKTVAKCPSTSFIPLPANHGNPTPVSQLFYQNFLFAMVNFLEQWLAIMKDPAKMEPVIEAQGEPQNNNLAASLQPHPNAAFGTHLTMANMSFAMPSNAVPFYPSGGNMNEPSDMFAYDTDL